MVADLSQCLRRNTFQVEAYPAPIYHKDIGGAVHHYRWVWVQATQGQGHRLTQPLKLRGMKISALFQRNITGGNQQMIAITLAQFKYFRKLLNQRFTRLINAILQATDMTGRTAYWCASSS